MIKMNRRMALLSLATSILGVSVTAPLSAAERERRDTGLFASAPVFLWVRMVNIKDWRGIYQWLVEREVIGLPDGTNLWPSDASIREGIEHTCACMLAEQPQESTWWGGPDFDTPLRRSVVFRRIDGSRYLARIETGTS